MTPDDELRAIAEAATQGPWKFAPGYYEGDDWPIAQVIIGEYHGWITTDHVRASEHRMSEKEEDDAKFLATFNPECVKGLLDRIAKAEAEVADVRRQLNRCISQAVECPDKIAELEEDLKEQREIVERQAGELMELSGAIFALRQGLQDE